MAPRILLCGDVLGRLNQLFKRVQSVNKSAGPFDALLCVGQFFPDGPERLDEFMEFIEGRSQVPLPTYFIGDYGVGSAKVLLAASKSSANQGFKMDGIEVSNNLFWLKGSGKFTLHGLSVAYLSGRRSAEAQQFGTYSQDDVDALRAIAEEPGIVDLFLTNEWPTDVTNRAATSDVPTGISDSVGSDSTVSELVAEIKPRYHIAGSKGVFYSREPYTNVDAVHITRFLGLAPVGNKDKQKFIHAISPTPASTMSAAEISMKSPNTTLSPYTIADQAASSKEDAKRPSDSDSVSQYWRYDVSLNDRNMTENVKRVQSAALSTACRVMVRAFRRRSGSEKSSANRSKECWFCLSSPNVESHLIVSIGEHYYCALPKGPLMPDHLLIIPVEHSPNTISVPKECQAELCKLQSRLKMYYKNREGCCLFEWVSKRSSHANLQAVPIPSSRAAAVPDIFKLAAERMGFKFEAIKSNSDDDGRKSLQTEFDRNYSFFYAELLEVLFYHTRLKRMKNSQLSLGEVLAGLLNMADRADWRNCTVGKEEEMKMVEDLKERFKEFDPNQ